MKRANRVKLRCSKRIKGTIYDAFETIVTENNKDSAIKEYKRQGYDVLEK